MVAGRLDEGILVAGRYVLLEALGEGGFGEVWKARDQKLDRPVAVKFMRPQLVGNAGLRRRFERESRALAAIKHPNVVQVFDDGEWEGRPFVVLEFVDGGTLRDWLEGHRKLRKGTPLEEVRALFVQVCEGVAAAHRVQIVHRDLKPENVLIEYDHEGRATAKVLDFGLARVGEGQSSVALQVGTYAYMSPEQAAEGSDAVGPASDVFSLGVMLVEMLTGRVLPDENSKAPWERAVLAGKAAAALERLRSVRPEVPMALWAVVARALVAETIGRHAHAGELRREVDQAWGAPAERTSIAPRASAWTGHDGPKEPMASVLAVPSLLMERSVPRVASTPPPALGARLERPETGSTTGTTGSAVAPGAGPWRMSRTLLIVVAVTAATALSAGTYLLVLRPRALARAAQAQRDDQQANLEAAESRRGVYERAAAELNAQRLAAEDEQRRQAAAAALLARQQAQAEDAAAAPSAVLPEAHPVARPTAPRVRHHSSSHRPRTPARPSGNSSEPDLGDLGL